MPETTLNVLKGHKTEIKPNQNLTSVQNFFGVGPCSSEHPLLLCQHIVGMVPMFIGTLLHKM